MSMTYDCDCLSWSTDIFILGFDLFLNYPKQNTRISTHIAIQNEERNIDKQLFIEYTTEKWDRYTIYININIDCILYEIHI